MRSLNMEVFDEELVGTVSTWYTSAGLNDLLGEIDNLQFFAVATNVHGTPSLNVYVDGSSDNRNWVQSTQTNGSLSMSPVTENAMGQFTGGGSLSFLRLRVMMTGTTPGCGCRLQIGATGRNLD